MKISTIPFVAAASGSLLIKGAETEAFCSNQVSPARHAPDQYHAHKFGLGEGMRQAGSRQQVTRLKAIESNQNSSPVLNNKKLDQLLPVEQFMGCEGVRQLPINHNPLKQNYFFRTNVPGMGVSPHWPSRVRNLSDKGPFPVERALLDLQLSSGKTLSVVIDYPAQKELDSNQFLPIVFYNPPGFVGEVSLPFGKVFYDAQIGLPFMNHLASYGMVSVTLLEPGSVLLDGVDKVNHQEQAEELNEVIDQVVAPDCLPALNLPSVNKDRIGLLAYSRGAKVALMAASDRIGENKRAGVDARVISIAKDPVNLGGVPPAVLEQIPPSIRQLIPEGTLKSWEQSSHRYPLAPVPGDDEDGTYPISGVSDAVLVFEGQPGLVNPDIKYGARAIFDKLPKDDAKKNLLVEVNGAHESWVNDYGVKGDSLGLIAAYFLTHLCDRQEFARHLDPAQVMKSEFGTFKSVNKA